MLRIKENKMSDAHKKLKVGDTVHWSDVNSRRGELSSGKVTKVGRKLVTVDHRVFRLDTLCTNDEYGHQSLVLDVQSYQDQRSARTLSRALSEYLLRNEIDLSKLKQIAVTLGVPA
jgi:hypothetical protein